MNEPIDDKTLAQYLERGSEFSKRYRDVPADDVPPELDSLVLANAALELTRKPAPTATRWKRWSAPLAVAATIVFGVSVVMQTEIARDGRPVAEPAFSESQLAPPNEAITPAIQVEARIAEAPRQAEPEALAGQRMEVTAKADQPARTKETTNLRDTEMSRESGRITADETVMPTTAAAVDELKKETVAPVVASPPPAPQFANRAPASAPAAAPTLATSSAVMERGAKAKSTEAVSMEEAIDTARRRTTAPASSEPRYVSDKQLSKAEREADPIKWLAFIRQLRATGKGSEADEEWQRFVKTYPTYEVRQDDSARGKK